jgi:hypothetical protein
MMNTNFPRTYTLGTDHLTCREGGLCFFSPEFNFRLYDKNSESDYYFFLPPKSEYFFQQHWESEYFFRKKP